MNERNNLNIEQAYLGYNFHIGSAVTSVTIQMTSIEVMAASGAVLELQEGGCLITACAKIFMDIPPN